MPPTIALLLPLLVSVSARIYDRCELARELRFLHEFPVHEVPTWMCVVAHESIYDTAAMNPGSGDHGLFQISQLYWCSPPGDGFGCNAPCDSFRDDNIADDVKCVRRIFKEHSRISGDGFNAWAVYPLYCKGDNSRYVRGCFDDDIDNSVAHGEQERPLNASTSTEKPDSEDDDEGYEFPPLPVPPKKSLENSISTDEDVYEFPPLPTTQHNQDVFPSPTTPNRKDLISNNDNIFKFSTPPTTQKTFSKAEKSLKTSGDFTHPTIIPFTFSTTTPFAKETFPPSTPPYQGVYKTTRYITKKPYTIKVSSKATTSSGIINARQITYRPFGKPNTTATLRPMLGLPRPPSPPRPLFSRPTTRHPPSRPSSKRPRPTLRPHTRFTTAGSNRNSIFFSSTTPIFSTRSTSTAPGVQEVSSSENKNIYKLSTSSQTSNASKKSTLTPLTLSFATTQSSTSSKNAKTLLIRSNVEDLKDVGLKASSSIKPPSSSASGNSLKKEERRYDNEFPGYFFSRIRNGFRLVQKI